MESNEDRERDHFFDLIQPHLGNLNESVRHEIEYSLSTGDLKSDELTVEDVIDTVVLKAFEEYKKNPPQFPLDRWLVMLAMKYIRNEIRNLRQDRQDFVHLEENIPEVAPEEKVVTLGEETLDFYQPDEDLRMEDVVADPTAETPEQVLEITEEVRELAKDCLAEVPRGWRDAFVLRRVQGFSIAEIAEITNQDQEKVKKDLQQAESCVKKKLSDYRINARK